MQTATVSRSPEQQRAFDTLVREVRELRPLPAIASRLLAMAAESHFSAQDLARAVAVDQALTIRILRLANSPMFGLPRRITTLREAIVLLGFREVRSLALTACVVDGADNGLPAESMLEYDRFWQNSLLIALLAQVLADAEGRDREEAFTAGVLHSVGRLAWAQRRPAWLRVAVLRARELGRAVHDVQREVFNFTDADTGAALVQNWSFPDPLVAAVAHHAMPPDAFDRGDELDAMVVRARRFARAHRISDGIDECGDQRPDAEWTRPAVANALRHAGGLQGLLQRAREFIEGTSAT